MKAGPYIQRRYLNALRSAETLRAAARVKVEEAASLRREADRLTLEAARWALDTDVQEKVR